jgi:hypothetical protein
MALSAQSRSVLLLAAFIDVVLGLAFILIGESVFALTGDVALIVGLVLIGSGATMGLITLIARRSALGPAVRRDHDRPPGKVVDRD